MEESKNKNEANNSNEAVTEKTAITNQEDATRLPVIHKGSESPTPETVEVQHIKLNKLKPFKNHPFKLYEGQRKHDMIESIRTHGILSPIIVRPAEDGNYEILSGHNRVEAAREIENLDKAPAIVRYDLTDDNDALFVVTESNLIQRSFEDMSHSERAAVLATHYNALKKKSGYRSDLLEGIDLPTEDGSKDGSDKPTNSPTAKRLSSMDKVGKEHGLSKDTIARYLRVDKLIPELKKRLDNDDIALRVAVSLSYLGDKEQKVIEDLLSNGQWISIGQASTLKEAYKEKEKLSKDAIKKILKPVAKVKPVKLGGEFLSQYFNDKQDSNEIERIINEALSQYYAGRDVLSPVDESEKQA